MKLKQIPRCVITDGLAGYSSMVEYLKARHILCHFHHQQRITVWLKKHFQDKEQIAARKSKMKKVFQTQDKRIVRRRLGKLKESSQELGISEWTQQTEASRMPLYQLINDPFGTVLELEDVKKNVRMADFPLKECIAA